jgi:streptogrisin C
MTRLGPVRGLAVVFAVAALAVSGATPANAQGLSPSGDRPAADAAAGEAALREALERDLGVSGEELDELLAASAAAVELDAQLQDELGDEFAGSWFDRETGSLTVAVTDAGAAQLASAAGAETTVVTHSEQDLTAITDGLDEVVEADPSAAADLFAWAIDVTSNQVVVTARAGEADSVESLVAEYGDAVRIEESTTAPQPAQDYPWLDGGIPYNGCSTGFNMRNVSTGVRYVLTAGHCGDVGNIAVAGNGQTIGPFVASFFPGYDDALIEVTNTGYWLQGPFVFTWPGFITVSSTFTDGPVGTPICKSGKTTGWTCGAITGKRVTVDYFDTAGNFIGTMFDLTQHNACVIPGDSGGSNVNAATSPASPEGVTSGGVFPNGQCIGGGNSISWYYPAAISVPYYTSAFGATLW